MPWARFDDGRHASGKLIAAGLEANGLDANAITWCSANLTDGFVPDAVLPVLAAGSVTPAAELAARLVAVDRWSRDDERGGWWVHDYLDYNPTRDEVVVKREKRREAGRKGGKRSGESRRAAADEANAQANASTLCEPRPVPSRPVVGSVDRSLSSSRGVRGDDDDAFADTVTLIVRRRVERAHPAGGVTNVAAYRATVRRSVIDELAGDIAAMLADGALPDAIADELEPAPEPPAPPAPRCETCDGRGQVLPDDGDTMVPCPDCRQRHLRVVGDE